MRRFPAFDPPEYVDWKPEPALARPFREAGERGAERRVTVQQLEDDEHDALYAGLLRARLHDSQLERRVKTGVISKAWLGTGEEATTVGPVHALKRGQDVVAPMIRNAAACCELGMPVVDMLRAYLGSADSPSGGRDLHVGGMQYGVLQPISHVGDVVPVTAGIALGFKLRKEPRVALTGGGDRSTKTAAVHEGTNFAAVQHLPVIFIIQNNQVALGTTLQQHHLPADFDDWAGRYGAWGAGPGGRWGAGRGCRGERRRWGAFPRTGADSDGRGRTGADWGGGAGGAAAGGDGGGAAARAEREELRLLGVPRRFRNSDSRAS